MPPLLLYLLLALAEGSNRFLTTFRSYDIEKQASRKLILRKNNEYKKATRFEKK